MSQVLQLSRSPLERLLWGAVPELCAECGVEVKARDAIRHTSRRAYCSVQHAAVDR